MTASGDIDELYASPMGLWLGACLAALRDRGYWAEETEQWEGEHADDEDDDNGVPRSSVETIRGAPNGRPGHTPMTATSTSTSVRDGQGYSTARTEDPRSESPTSRPVSLISFSLHLSIVLTCEILTADLFATPSGLRTAPPGPSTPVCKRQRQAQRFTPALELPPSPDGSSRAGQDMKWAERPHSPVSPLHNIDSKPCIPSLSPSRLQVVLDQASHPAHLMGWRADRLQVAPFHLGISWLRPLHQLRHQPLARTDVGPVHSIPTGKGFASARGGPLATWLSVAALGGQDVLRAAVSSANAVPPRTSWSDETKLQNIQVDVVGCRSYGTCWNVFSAVYVSPTSFATSSLPSSAAAANVIDKPALVLKLCDLSRFPLFRPIGYSILPTRAELSAGIWREVRALEMLREVQGEIVPRVFGLWLSGGGGGDDDRKGSAPDELELSIKMDRDDGMDGDAQQGSGEWTIGQEVEENTAWMLLMEDAGEALSSGSRTRFDVG